MLKRRNDWPERLDECFRKYRNVPFEMGTHDCGIFALRCVEAMTGASLVADILGKYSTQEEEMALLMAKGQALGVTEISVRMAQRGDLVLWQSKDSPALISLLVVGMDGINCWGPGETGLRPQPLREALKAWRI